jgi:hypothetical protein
MSGWPTVRGCIINRSDQNTLNYICPATVYYSYNLSKMHTLKPRLYTSNKHPYTSNNQIHNRTEDDKILKIIIQEGVPIRSLRSLVMVVSNTSSHRAIGLLWQVKDPIIPRRRGRNYRTQPEKKMKKKRTGEQIIRVFVHSVSRSIRAT